MAKVPIDEGWAWWVLLGASINIFMVIGGFKSMGIIFVHVVEQFDASPTLPGLMVGLMSFGLSVFAPFVTAVGSRFSYRLVAIFGAVVMAMGFLLTAFGTNIYHVICVLGIFVGMANGCLFTPSMIMVGQYFDRYRSMAMGIMMAGGSVGQLVLPIVIQYLLDQVSFYGCMMIYSGIVAQAIFGSLLLRPQTFYTERAREAAKRPLEQEAVASKENVGAASPPALRNLHKRGFNLSALSLTVTPSPSLNSLVFKSHIKHNLTSTPMVHFNSTHSLSSMKSAKKTLVKEFNVDVKDISGSSHLFPTSVNQLTLQTEDSMCDRDSLKEKFPPEKDEGTKSESQGRAICKAITDIFDPLLLSSLAYWLYVVAISLAVGGYLNQFLFMPPYGQEVGLSKYQVTWILSGTGITDILGRIIGGALNNLQLIATVQFCALSLVLAGASIAVTMGFTSFVSLIVHGVLLGFLGGMFMSLYPVALVELVGLELFPKAISLSVLAIGLFTLGLPPLFGQMEIMLGSYAPGFYVCLFMMGLSGIVFLLIPVAQKYELKKKGGTQAEEPPIKVIVEDDNADRASEADCDLKTSQGEGINVNS